jgi:hypothetical protein
MQKFSRTLLMDEILEETGQQYGEDEDLETEEDDEISVLDVDIGI